MSLATKQGTHTFLLVKIFCGRQGKKQHGKTIRHMERRLFGVLGVIGEGQVKPSVERR